jgi:hypothetical protein
MLFVRTIKTDSLNLYALGVFYNRSDAVTYIGYLKGLGLNDAYIINQYDIDNAPEQSDTGLVNEKPALTRKAFSIQLKATRSPIDIRKIFPGYEGVREIVADDGFYKYLYGEYSSIANAKEALIAVRKDFDDAFIREVNIPINK